MSESRFAKDNHFEERVVQALITDHKFAEQMCEVLDVDFFNLEHLRSLTGIIFEYHKEYNAFPSYKLLFTLTKEHVSEEITQRKIGGFLLKIKKEPLNGDLEYIKERSLDFCKKKSLIGALSNCLELVEEKKYDQTVYEIQRALAAGSEKDLGHDYQKDFDARMTVELRNPIPTPWEEINKIIKGGPSGGFLGVIAAPTGVGKSHALVDIGSCAMMAGYNVAHYTFELSQFDTGLRYDSRVTDISVDHLISRKEEVRSVVNGLKGKLMIKEYPTKSITSLGIKNHINNLRLRNFDTDIVLIDYADLMRSRHKYDQKRIEEESIYEELRGLSNELGIPFWTVTQTNRAGMDADVIMLTHIAECINKSWIADLFLTMNRNKENSPTTFGNFHLAKSRLGPDGIVFPIMVNTSTSNIKVLDPDSMEEGMSREEQLQVLYKKHKKEKSKKETSKDPNNNVH